MASLNKYGILYLYIGSMDGRKIFLTLNCGEISSLKSYRSALTYMYVRRTLCKNFLNFEANSNKKRKEIASQPWTPRSRGKID